MNGRKTTARRHTRSWGLLGIAGLLCASIVLVSAPASAQSADCAALRARIDAGAQAPDAGRLDPAIGENRAELDRVRGYADESGCSGASVFDDPSSPECDALLRRAEQLRQTIARLEAGAVQNEGDTDRRAAIEEFNAACTGGGADAALPTPDTLVPVDPDAPTAPPSPNPAPANRIARVLCVRHCDGAYYPLAVDVPTDKLDGMSELCQAQCPAAESSAYADTDGDVSKAETAAGTSYAALPAAFKFEKGTSATCTCRASGESWAQALAKAQAMIGVQEGDVVVTPEIQANMALPRIAPQAKPAVATPRPKATPKRAKASPPKKPPAVGAETANPGQDLTREFRQAAPTL